MITLDAKEAAGAKMRILGLILCVGLFAVPAAAKWKVIIAIDVADARIKSELISGIAAKFNSTDRYTTTQSATDSDILLGVICVPVKFENSNYNLGEACAIDALYYPFKNGLSHHLAEVSSIITDIDIQKIINRAVEDLINATTDEKLAEYKKTTIDEIHLICWNEPGICRLPPEKQ